MTEPSSLPESIRNLNSLASTYLDETSTVVKSILNTVHTIIPPAEFEQLLKQKQAPPLRDQKDQLIAALELNRLTLLTEIQDQDATKNQLMTMIHEYEELANALTAYSSDLVNRSSSDDAIDEETNPVSNLSELTAVEMALDENLARLHNAMSQLKKKGESHLEIIDRSMEDSLSEDNQHRLDGVIAKLNECL